MAIVKSRDPKGLYKKAGNGELTILSLKLAPSLINEKFWRTATTV
jgi:hypothetical protein